MRFLKFSRQNGPEVEALRERLAWLERRLLKEGEKTLTGADLGFYKNSRITGYLLTDAIRDKIVAANEAAARIFGLTTSGLEGVRLSTLFPKEEFPALDLLFTRVLEGEYPAAYSVPCHNISRKTRYCDIEVMRAEVGPELFTVLLLHNPGDLLPAAGETPLPDPGKPEAGQPGKSGR